MKRLFGCTTFVFICCLLTLASTAQEAPRRPGKPGLPSTPKAPVSNIAMADSAFQKTTWISSRNDTLRYRLLMPENYDASKKYPLVLFLHGAGERGNDNLKQLTHGAALFLKPEVRKSFPAIVVFPQCDSGSYWSNVEITVNDSSKKREFHFREDGEPTTAMAKLLEWLPAIEKQYKMDAARRYVIGLSMGGMGTFEIVRRMPAYFAAAAPICGGANPGTAKAIRNCSFWVFHGKKDDVVPYRHSVEMVEALQKFYDRGDINFTLYENANHNSWDAAFAEPDLLPWLFNKKLNKN